MSRPEDILPPDLYYNESASAKYTTSSRIQHIQTLMTRRALELLHLSSPSLILDVGCGSGLSGSILSSHPHNHTWVGLDISPHMLQIALERDDTDNGDLFLADMGQGLPFRPGTFDAAISISAIQWLCNADSSDVSPEGRLRRFFDGLYACLRRGARAVCQFYAKNETQRKMITDAAIRAGFGAGLLVDDEGTKSEKVYLVLNVGGGDVTGAVADLAGVQVEDNRKITRDGTKKAKAGRGEIETKGSRQWILRKKEQMKMRGKIVKNDSKYTGRRRKVKF